MPRTPKPTVLLFDIDGTLLDTGGAGRRAMEIAFERAAGHRDACAGIRFGGMTDRAIARAGLEAVGASSGEADIDRVLAAYLAALEEELPETHARVHAGIEAALDASKRAGAAVGLGTGNVRAGAMLKLARVGLAERFAFGGFGCDHEDRAELLRAGATRGALQAKADLAACRVVVIGDTPKDVAAAHAIGATAVAVATGGFNKGELSAAGAAFVFANLEETGALDALLDA